MIKNLFTYTLGGIAIILLVIVLWQSFGSGAGLSNVMPKDKVGEYTLNFIEQELASPGTEFTLKGVEEVNGIYRVDFEVMGQTDSAYVTKNGKYLFFQPIDMQPPEPKSFTKTDKPEVDLFVMSYCPYGNQAEELMMPVANLLGDKANIENHYIIYNNYATGYPDYCLDKEKTYCSMHGVEEVNQDIRELCVQKYQKDKFRDFIKEINSQTTAEDVEQKWEGIASNLGIDVEQVKTCQADEGLALLKDELDLASAQYPVQDPTKHKGQEKQSVSGSPTLVINGMIYDGPRTANDFKEAICSAFKNPPAQCQQDLISNSAPANPGSCE